MPRVQRSLSANDLLQRFRDRRVETAGQHGETQGQNLPAIPVPSPPPAVPPDLEALRSCQHRGMQGQLPPAVSVSSQQAIRLSTKLPDPPVFSGTNSHVPFDDWKIRIQDKLTHNSDHYPSESFKVAYVTSRLSGEASKHISLKRRQGALTTSMELLDQLSDLYETPLSVIYKENSHALHYLKQGIKQPFPEFYAKWVRYSERGYTNDMAEDLKIWDLEDRLKEELREPFTSVGCYKPWTVSDSKAYLTKLDQFQRLAADGLAQEKAQAFAARYARAKAESEAKAKTKRSRSSQQIKILSRSDSGYETNQDPAYWR